MRTQFTQTIELKRDQTAARRSRRAERTIIQVQGRVLRRRSLMSATPARRRESTRCLQGSSMLQCWRLSAQSPGKARCCGWSKQGFARSPTVWFAFRSRHLLMPMASAQCSGFAHPSSFAPLPPCTVLRPRRWARAAPQGLKFGRRGWAIFFKEAAARGSKKRSAPTNRFRPVAPLTSTTIWRRAAASRRPARNIRVRELANVPQK
jgi:hypothetical protein